MSAQGKGRNTSTNRSTEEEANEGKALKERTEEEPGEKGCNS